MGLFSFLSQKDHSWRKTLAKVEDWQPSLRPKYKNKITGVIYTLDKVGPNYVTLRKSCGRTVSETLSDFEQHYQRF